MEGRDAPAAECSSKVCCQWQLRLARGRKRTPGGVAAERRRTLATGHVDQSSRLSQGRENAGRQPQGLGIDIQAVMCSPGFLQDRAEIAIGFDVARIELQGKVKLRNRLLGAMHRLERQAEVVVRFGELRSDRQ